MIGTQTYYLLLIRGERARYHTGLVGKRTKRSESKTVTVKLLYNV